VTEQIHSTPRTADPLADPLEVPDDPSPSRVDSENVVVRQRGLRSAAASEREILLQGRRAFEQGDDSAALAHLSRLTSRLTSHGVEYADVHYMIGILHERQGRLDDALESLRRAIGLNPRYAEALLALASLYESRGDFEQSRGFAERASTVTRPVAGRLDPTTRGKLANQQAALADALLQAGEARDAIEEFRRALERCPHFHDIRHRLGIALRSAGLPHQAAQEFRRILSDHPSMLESQIQLGLTYYSIGQSPEAVREWNAVLERDPSRDDARMYLRLVQSAHRQGVARRDDRQEGPPDEKGWSKVALDAKDSEPLAPPTQDLEGGEPA
jgi:tetratricopeptide (TPR) repeat protein